MSSHHYKRFQYYAYAIIGWFLILIGAVALYFMIVSAGDIEGRLKVSFFGLGLMVAGVLLVRRIEKNIFKAFAEVFWFII